MSFDPEMFGQAMAEQMLKALAPLRERIAEIEKQIAERPDVRGIVAEEVAKAVSAIPAPVDGKDADMDVVKGMIDEALKAAPVPKDGKDADPEVIKSMVQEAVSALPKPADGKSITVEDVLPILNDAIKSMREKADAEVAAAVKAIPAPKDGRDGVDGKDGADGEKGDDGAGIADLMIDRDGNLIATMTDGRMKSLGLVIGRDGKDGADGKDGVSLDAFEMDYLSETHEIRIKASCAGRTVETRFAAGGIRLGGDWRDGVKAQAGEAWSLDGSLWIAKCATPAKPSWDSADWMLAARKGRDGAQGARGRDAAIPGPIQLDGK